MWKWKTVCHALDPHELMRFTPSDERFSDTRCAITCAVRAHAARSSGSISSRSVACSRGITSLCPRVAGWMSMTAIVRSSSYTRVLGISPATILQNRQSGAIAPLDVGFDQPADRVKRAHDLGVGRVAVDRRDVQREPRSLLVG